LKRGSENSPQVIANLADATKARVLCCAEQWVVPEKGGLRANTVSRFASGLLGFFLLSFWI
jgi:hypothetical protein